MYHILDNVILIMTHSLLKNPLKVAFTFLYTLNFDSAYINLILNLIF